MEQPAPFPQGRTDLSPEALADDQRERVILGIATILAERGFGDLTVENIAAAARISRTTFFDLFTGMQEAALFAQEILFERFLAAIRKACDAQQEWPEKVKAAIEASFDFAEACPAQAHLLASGFLAGDPVLAARVLSSHQQLADLLAEGRRHYPETASLPPVTEEALIGALGSVITRGLALDETERAAMRSQLVELTLIPYLGSAGAAVSRSGLQRRG